MHFVLSCHHSKEVQVQEVQEAEVRADQEVAVPEDIAVHHIAALPIEALQADQ